MKVTRTRGPRAESQGPGAQQIYYPGFQMFLDKVNVDIRNYDIRQVKKLHANYELI